MSCVCLSHWSAGQLAGLLSCNAKMLVFWHYTQTVLPMRFIPASVYRHHWLIPLYATFSDLDLAWGHKVSAKENLLASFLTHFSADWDEIRCGDKVEHRDTTLSKIERNKGITAVLLTVSKYFNVGMHSDIYWSVWYKLGMMIDTTALCILILV